MRTSEGWVYRHVTVTAEPGDVLEVRGAGGTGRSMLLLTLVGRARPTAGTLTVLGHELPQGSRAVRRLASVARLDDVIEPEDQQTVAQAFRERARWDRVHRAGQDGLSYRVDEARELTGLRAADDERVAGLPAVQRTLLAVALAVLARPRLLVLDDLDDGLPPDEQVVVWAALGLVAAADDCLAVATTDGGDPRDGHAGRSVLELHPTHLEES
jgi:ABC-type multidrug transport system ATPase subunit